MKCSAHKSNGDPCKAYAVKGKKVCRTHGGKTPHGAASPHFKTGRYSKYLPENMLPAYEDAKADKQQFSLGGDIELLDAFIRSKLNNLDFSESSQHWAAILKCIIKARKAYKNSDIGELESQLDDMEAIADKRRLHYATEQEVVAQLEQRRKLVESEQKMMLQDQRAIPIEQAMLLMSAVLESINRNITDVSALTAIKTDFLQLIGANAHQWISAEVGSENG